jgi:mannose-6-phosphate isomerase-like protein (cupin superfamily)
MTLTTNKKFDGFPKPPFHPYSMIPSLKHYNMIHPQIPPTEATMQTPPINFVDKFSKFSDLWSPKIIAQMNDYHLKIAKIKGEFIWHSHPETDEVFIVIAGQMIIHLRDGEVELNAGEMYVVPRGVEHKPSAEGECQILLIEPIGTVNTGDAGGEMTVENDEWI